MLGGLVFQQTVGIPMGTNRAPLLVDLFFYSYVRGRLQTGASEEIRKEANPIL